MKNFFDSKDEKITEKAFSQSMIISVVSILLCIVMICSMTYAWFTNETSSNSNTLMSGSFGVTISVTKLNDGTATASDVAVTSDPNNIGKYICDLEVGTYTVTLNLTNESTVKGHCIVTVGNDTAKHTAAIVGEKMANDENGEQSDPFTFTITVTQPTTVTFEPRWGVVVDPDIENGGTYPISESNNQELSY